MFYNAEVDSIRHYCVSLQLILAALQLDLFLLSKHSCDDWMAFSEEAFFRKNDVARFLCNAPYHECGSFLYASLAKEVVNKEYMKRWMKECERKVSQIGYFKDIKSDRELEDKFLVFGAFMDHEVGLVQGQDNSRSKLEGTLLTIQSAT